VKHLYYLYHVPKTGGQTIRDHLDANLVRGRDFLHLGRWDQGRELTFDDVEALTAEQRGALRSIGGHPLTRPYKELFPDRVVREVVFVREPASRIVSHYNFNATMTARRGNPVPSFDEFRAGQPPNPMTKFLKKTFEIPSGPSVLSEVLAVLADLWMVGTTESLDLLAPTLFERLGIGSSVPSRSNVSGGMIDRHLALTPDLADELRDEAALDLMLYEACRRFERSTMERLSIVAERGPRRPIGFAPT